jgi:cbb3-type cytochrome oxidase subunit 1
MHKRNRLFITLSLLYGLLGGLIGITLLLDPSALPGDVPLLHGHIMMLGFIAMMIYGVGLHVLPRFSGRPLYSERLADWQLYIANLGLWIMAAGWMTLREPLLATGGALSWLGIALFTVNILFTVRHYGPGG